MDYLDFLEKLAYIFGRPGGEDFDIKISEQLISLCEEVNKISYEKGYSAGLKINTLLAENNSI